MSELLRRLDRQLQEERDPVVRAELNARRAAYLARIGFFDDAQELISELRSSARSPGFERIAVWVILCEGILDYFKNVHQNFSDRIMRAQRLSVALRDEVLVPVTSAWLTFAEHERGRFKEMSEAAALALRSARSDDHESLARVSATLSHVFLTAGDRETSRLWFEKAHHHAVAAGDQASIEALIYNRASFGLARCRVDACFGELDSSEVTAVRLWIQSAKNFHALAGMRSLSELNDLSLARLCITEGNFAQALEALEGCCLSANRRYASDMMNLERSFCLAKLGFLDEAHLAYSRLSDIELVGLDEDDRLIVSSMQVSLAKADSRFGDEQAALTRFRSRIAEYDEFQQMLRVTLEPVCSPPSIS